MSHARRAAAGPLVADDVAHGLPLGSVVAEALESTLAATTILVRGSSALLAAGWGLSVMAVEENNRAIRAIAAARPADALALQAEIGRAAVRRGVERALVMARMASEVAEESCYPVVHFAWRTLERRQRSSAG